MRIIAVIHADKGKDTYGSGSLTFCVSVRLTLTSTWDFVPRNLWSITECDVGIICACLPVLKSPFLRGLATVLGTTHKSADPNSIYELRGPAQRYSRSRTLHQISHRSGGTPWEGEDDGDDAASDEVQIIACAEVQKSQRKEPVYGHGKNEIYVTKEFRVVQNDE